MADYTDVEMARLRSALVNFRTLSNDDLQEIGRAIEAGHCPPHLGPFWRLASSDNDHAAAADLFRKLEGDRLVASYSCYGFFPGIHSRLYQQGERPEFWLDGRTRGQVALFRFASGKGFVVKPLQSRREAEIARLAGDAGVGPHQFTSLEGFLVEELVNGRFITEYAEEELDDGLIFQIGLTLGSMLSTLHNAGICYNDATLSDPDGRSHLFVRLPDENRPGQPPACTLIDFGVSVFLDRFPYLELEEVFNLVRTTPEYRFVSRLGLRGNELSRFLVQYRQRLSASDKEEILARDLRFTQEGLQQASRSMGAGIIAPFQQGFTEGYDRKGWYSHPPVVG